MQERFVALRIRGMSAREAVERLNEEDGGGRWKRGTWSSIASKLEAQTNLHQRARIGTAAMTDVQFAEWKRYKLELMIEHPKEYGPLALASLKKLEEHRQEMKFGSEEALWETLNRARERVRELRRLKRWVEERGLDAATSGEADVPLSPGEQVETGGESTPEAAAANPASTS